jgi:hypothetical protein
MGLGMSAQAYTTSARSLPEWRVKVHLYRKEMMHLRRECFAPGTGPFLGAISIQSGCDQILAR